MSFLLKNNAVFLHIPKTGGTFFREIIEQLGLRVLNFGNEHADMERTLHSFKYYPIYAMRSSILLGKNIDVHANQCFKFCFVRNPYSWYESYWRFMYGLHWNNLNNYRPKRKFELLTDNWNPINLLLPYADDNFNVFLENVLSAEPAFLTKLYERYTPPQHINYVGKQETLKHDASMIFDMLEVRFDKNIFEKTGRINESKTPRPIWSEELKNRIYEAERSVFEKYKYDCDDWV